MEQHIAGYILAGGKNLRMERRKKLFLTYEGKCFYEWTKEGLLSLNKLYVSVEKEIPYKEIREELVVDEYSGIGPLGGIWSGLRKCQEEALLVVPCDMVPFPFDLIKEMLTLYEKDRHPVVIKNKGRLLPFPGIYTKAMIPLFEKMIKEHRYRVAAVWEDMEDSFAVLDIKDAAVPNINTKEEYDMLRGK